MRKARRRRRRAPKRSGCGSPARTFGSCRRNWWRRAPDSAVSARGSRPHVRPETAASIESKYFLSGFARCATCRGTLSVLSRSHGRRRMPGTGASPMRSAARPSAPTTWCFPLERVDAAVVTELLTNVLRPKVVTAILDGVFEAIDDSTAPTNIVARSATSVGLNTKITVLTDAVESGAALAPLVKKLHERQAERDALPTAIAAAEGAEQVAARSSGH